MTSLLRRARRLRRSRRPILAGLGAALLASCSTGATTTTSYVPRSRDVTITTVPLLVKEQQGVPPFLEAGFAKGGVLDGKQVSAFSPSTVTMVEGDTIHFTLINPEDDVHSFVLPDLAVSLPPQAITRATYVATHAGILPILCAIQAHLPMMSGQLVVLSASAMAGHARCRPPSTVRRQRPTAAPRSTRQHCSPRYLAGA